MPHLDGAQHGARGARSGDRSASASVSGAADLFGDARGFGPAPALGTPLCSTCLRDCRLRRHFCSLRRPQNSGSEAGDDIVDGGVQVGASRLKLALGAFFAAIGNGRWLSKFVEAGSS